MRGTDRAGRNLHGICFSDVNIECVVRIYKWQICQVCVVIVYALQDQMSIKSASICGAFFKDLKGFPVELDVENLLIAANCGAKRQAWTEC